MPENVTGGDLYRLWRVSEVNLPRVADVFYDAGQALGRAAGGSTAFPARDSVYPGASFKVSALGTAWEDLRSTMQSIMIEMGDVVMDTARGVRVARELFDRVDQESGKTLLEAYMGPEGTSVTVAEPGGRAGHDYSEPASNPPVPGTPEHPVRPDSAPSR
ncbi:hypothetical protein [Actinoplanes utahensis]|uniref:Uncharacterized protein n=1 Tax=Actinoplanes utahensis TaxID=1869 RepID=A0A0A6UPB4_ACTUT|nr:hypothetical protein [Actinoplanes utahensis]KHD77985.1 hypothetical protein MB27_07675 [Actinoplanes utahensis]GIF29971.1 hypothetical protein Aut01nite_29570 [Actinoplanes utahensis]